VGIFPEGEDSRGDHGLGRLVEFRSVTLLPCPGGKTTKSTRTCGGRKKKHIKVNPRGRGLKPDQPLTWFGTLRQNLFCLRATKFHKQNEDLIGLPTISVQ